MSWNWLALLGLLTGFCDAVQASISRGPPTRQVSRVELLLLLNFLLLPPLSALLPPVWP